MCYNIEMVRPDHHPLQTSAQGHDLAPEDMMSESEVLHPKIWHDLVDAYVDRARMDHKDLSALLVDIDATKAVNDELGHQAGTQLIDTVDRITSIVPGMVRSNSSPGRADRPADLVMSHSSQPPQLESVVPGAELPSPQRARIGGDEFGIILPFTNRDGANTVASRIRKGVDEELAKPGNQELAEMGAGVSIGVVTWEPGMNASDFLRIADQSMYADKLKQLRVLSPEEQSEFMTAVEHLQKSGVRPRDVPKYIQLFGALSLNEAFENHAQPD